jgi:VCBS repeat protein/FG-GAP repeat protein
MRPGSLARGLCVGCVVVLVAAASSDRTRAQSEAWRAHGVSSIPGIGTSVAFLGDVDGDGVPDYVGGGPAIGWGSLGDGQVLVCSGATGAVLFDFTGAVRAEFGAAVASAGDIDADGHDDVAVGAPKDGPGAVYIYSGATGALLRTLSGASADSLFGSSLANLGDIDGDGIADLAVGAPDDASGGSQTGLAVIYSGATGGVLAQWTGASIGGGFGSVVANAGDVDHHLLDDLLVVEQADSSSGTAVGTARVYSSESFTLLTQWTMGATAGGWTAANAGDVTGDLVPDLVFGNDLWPFHWISYHYGYYAEGGVWVVDGVTGAVLFSDTDRTHTGSAVCAAGDVDGDGYADFAYGLWDQLRGIQGFRVISGSGGNLLLQGTSSGLIRALQGGVDVNGDGVPELVLGVPDGAPGNQGGEVDVVDSASGSYLWKSLGSSRLDALPRTSALLDDVNGDGVRDVLVGTGYVTSPGYARVLSGVDGSELRAHAGPAGVSYASSVAALPDIDGDGIGEYTIALPSSGPLVQGSIEVRSGATGLVIQTLSPGAGADGDYGFCCAAAIQPNGAVQLAVGHPSLYPTGAVHVFDVATGQLLLTKYGPGSHGNFGYSVAWLGDVNGDGVGDWVGGRPNFSANAVGTAVVFSGVDGKTLHSLTGAQHSAFGYATCGAGDVDGDGTPDFYVGAAWEGSPYQYGSVYLYSGATGGLLRSRAGTDFNLGSNLVTVGDVNGDGFDDVIFGEWGKALLISGGNGAVLYRFDGAMDGDEFGYVGTGVAAPGSIGSMNGDAIPDVAIGAPNDSTNGDQSGRLSLYLLDDLYLQIDPPAAAAGATVSLATSGGPPGALAMLVFRGFDSTPFFLPLSVGTFDSEGIWSLSGPVPPGLSGHTATLASYAIGFSGSVVDTQAMTLTFE